MRIIIIIGLLLTLSACKEACKDNGKGNDKDKEACEALEETPSEPIAQDPPSFIRSPITQPECPYCDLIPEDPEWAYLPLQVYSAHDFESGLPLKWCAYGECNEPTPIEGCHEQVLFPGDFTIYNETLGTFWNSVPEEISINHETRTITMTTNLTGHLGKSFKYKFSSVNAQWEVIFGENCSRLYEYALGYEP